MKLLEAQNSTQKAVVITCVKVVEGLRSRLAVTGTAPAYWGVLCTPLYWLLCTATPPP